MYNQCWKKMLVSYWKKCSLAWWIGMIQYWPSQTGWKSQHFLHSLSLFFPLKIKAIKLHEHHFTGTTCALCISMFCFKERLHNFLKKVIKTMPKKVKFCAWLLRIHCIIFSVCFCLKRVNWKKILWVNVLWVSCEKCNKWLFSSKNANNNGNELLKRHILCNVI